MTSLNSLSETEVGKSLISAINLNYVLVSRLLNALISTFTEKKLKYIKKPSEKC